MKGKRTVKRGNLAGFTLIELLVVVMIIGILASVGMPQYFKVVEKTRITEVQSFVSTVRSSQERYVTRHGQYAGSIGNLDIEYRDCTATGQSCGMKAYNFTTLTAVDNCGGSGANTVPGYFIEATRVTTGNVAVAKKYEGYKVNFNRCTETWDMDGNATAKTDLK
ncbi:MAG: prepilin-type N-terminal cleavage/methylation domain-containing protein [Elusimicrobia bacterium]|nr:prepilin-type N-terminal cleavage/methylation domain-containing protein [Elusimicrobiota bacterium]